MFSKKLVPLLSAILLLLNLVSSSFQALAYSGKVDSSFSVDDKLTDGTSSASKTGTATNGGTSSKGTGTSLMNLSMGVTPLAATSDGIKAAGNYYNDVPNARYNPLGAAQNFHIFAEKSHD